MVILQKLNLNFFFQFTLLILFSLLIWESRSYPLESSIYPRIVGGVTIILLLISLFRHFLKRQEEKKTDPESTLRLRRFLGTSLLIILATFLGYAGGFILSVLCYYVGYALLYENRAKFVRTLTIGLVLTVLFYISFGWFFHVPLLRGWLVNF